ncbi:transmembrane protein C17orf113-like isoform X2 [Rhinatrema bivittatum]|uniref:transmembrane protein C17orf113-like isoform X2 n=1 Tax=Rhinatrema bivittatum TaxID=194408 RepID=UPI00112E3DA5|nr:transmembrane protein C17orf113-like isoform X2 [Rhinatrema bivittatum]
MAAFPCNMVSPGKKPAGETSNSNKKCKRYFNEHWKEEFTWLEFDYERKLMFCMECRQALVKNKHGKAENAFTVGTDNFQRHTLLRHVMSGAHRQALAVNKEQLTLESRMHGHQELKSIIKVEVNPSKVAMLTSVYWMAKEGIPDEKYQSLLTFQKFNLCQALLTTSELHEYYHPSSVKDMQAAIVKVLQNEDKHRMRASPFVGLVVDETVDIMEHRHLVLFTTTVSPSDGQVCMSFLGNFELTSGESYTVTDKAVEVMHSFGVPTMKITWLSSDGSSLMTDRLSGVGTKLKCICPLLSEMHSVSHKSSLFPLESIGHIEYVKRYETTLDAVYRLYSNFKGERYSFQELQNVLISCNINLDSSKTVHWTSILTAVETIDSSWPTLVLLLESESENSPVALGLYEELKKFQFVALTKVLLDTLPIFQKLNQFFQIEDLDLSMVKPIVTASVTTLQAQKKTSGQNFQEFLSEMNEHPGEEDDDRFRYKGVELVQCSRAHLKNFEQVKESYLERVCANLQDRFPNNVLDVVNSFAVIFNPKSYPQSLDDIGVYGDEELHFLLQYYSHVVVCERAINDFPLFKRIVFSLSQLTCRDLCVKLVYTNSEMHELFPDFAVLAAVVLALPLGSFIYEKINRAKELVQANQCRCLKERLSSAMKIAVDGPAIEEFDFRLAIEYFENLKESNFLTGQVN